MGLKTMKIRELSRVWPPSATAGSGVNLSQADEADVVVGVQKYLGAQDHIGLTLRKVGGTEYGVSLILPEDLLEKASVILASHLPLTLQEVGEVNI
jgi:hypothetical protein